MSLKSERNRTIKKCAEAKAVMQGADKKLGNLLFQAS
jgi:hypothetical protein